MFYGAIINFRNLLFEKGIFKSYSLGVPTISVGNITVGGTGKTPLVAYIAELLANSGEKVCILTRGYGRENLNRRIVVSDGKNIIEDARKSGDEPLELANKLGEKAIIIADANRYEAGSWAREKFNISAFVLDDAFQHLRVKRELDLVCVDAANPFGNKKVLPFGILREPLKNLKRADAIIITRANLLNENQIAELKNEIEKLTIVPIFISRNKIKHLTELKTNGKEEKIKNKLYAFCALGNPNNFFDQLKNENYDLVGEKSFPDHHFYNQKDVAVIEETAKNSFAVALITTAKDAVKLKELDFELPCFAAENELVFDEEEKLHELVQSYTLRHKSKLIPNLVVSR